MSGPFRTTCAALAAAGVLALAAAPARAYFRNRGPVPAVGGDGQFADSDINIVENLGQYVPKDLVFFDGHGGKHGLGDVLGRGKPVLVTMGYYRCPMLCGLVHQGLAKGLRKAGLKPGRDFLGLAVSVDPNENPKSAVTSQRQLLRAIDDTPPDSTADVNVAAWPFLMPEPNKPGSDAAAKRLAEAVGFRYKYDEQSKQFAHAAVAFVLTPEGKISRYLYGVDFEPRDLRFSLVEASDGRVGTTLDRVLLSCFKYDPMTQRYTPYAFGFVRIGAGLSFAALLALLIVLWRREYRQRRAAVAARRTA